MVGHIDQGLVKEVTSVLANAKMTVLGIKPKDDTKRQVTILDLDIEIFNEADLPRVMTKLGGMDGVIEVKRVVN